MKFLKPTFSQVQKDFLDKFIRCLKVDFKGEQLAMSIKIGCDRSQISRWSNRENAPPDYVCHLLLKELAGDTFKKELGRRIKYLREEIFEVSLREFAWTLKLESISQLESIEHGDVELPRHCFEMLMRDYRVTAGYLDRGDRSIFESIPTSTESFLPFLKDGFKLHFFTPPMDHADYPWRHCYMVLHRPQEHVSQCFIASTTGSFKSTGGGLMNVEHALWAMMLDVQRSHVRVPTVLRANKKTWSDLCHHRFYKKTIHLASDGGDHECTERLDEIMKSLGTQFDSHLEHEKKKKAMAVDAASRLKSH